MVAVWEGQFSQEGARDVPTSGPGTGIPQTIAAPHPTKGAKHTMNLQLPPGDLADPIP